MNPHAGRSESSTKAKRRRFMIAGFACSFGGVLLSSLCTFLFEIRDLIAFTRDNVCLNVGIVLSFSGPILIIIGFCIAYRETMTMLREKHSHAAQVSASNPGGYHYYPPASHHPHDCHGECLGAKQGPTSHNSGAAGGAKYKPAQAQQGGPQNPVQHHHHHSHGHSHGTHTSKDWVDSTAMLLPVAMAANANANLTQMDTFASTGAASGFDYNQVASSSFMASSGGDMGGGDAGGADAGAFCDVGGGDCGGMAW